MKAKRRWAAAGLILGAVVLCAAAAARPKPPELALRVYDVRDILARQNFPLSGAVQTVAALAGGPTEQLRLEDLFGARWEDRWEREDPDELFMDLIMSFALHGLPEEDGRDLAFVNGCLLALETPEGHRRIAAFLDTLRAAFAPTRTVTVEAQWVSVDEEGAARLLAAPSGRRSPIEVTPKALAEAGAETVARAVVVCCDRQTVHAFSGSARRLLTDVGPIVATAAVGLDLVLEGVLLRGAAIEVTPRLGPDGDAVVLTVRSMLSEPGEVGRRDVRVGACENSDATAGCEVDLPEYEARGFNATMKAPLGRPFVAGGMTSPGGAEGTICLVLTVTASE